MGAAGMVFMGILTGERISRMGSGHNSGWCVGGNLGKFDEGVKSGSAGIDGGWVWDDLG